MFKLDNDFLTTLGLGTLPVDEKNKLLQHIYETLEMRVGMRLAEKMTDSQLDEFESFIDRNDEPGALRWLESNFPNYKDVVSEELDKLKNEVGASSQQILSAAQANAANAATAAQLGQPQQQMPQMPSAQPDSFGQAPMSAPSPYPQSSPQPAPAPSNSFASQPQAPVTNPFGQPSPSAFEPQQGFAAPSQPAQSFNQPMQQGQPSPFDQPAPSFQPQGPQPSFNQPSPSFDQMPQQPPAPSSSGSMGQMNDQFGQPAPQQPSAADPFASPTPNPFTNPDPFAAQPQPASDPFSQQPPAQQPAPGFGQQGSNPNSPNSPQQQFTPPPPGFNPDQQ